MLDVEAHFDEPGTRGAATPTITIPPAAWRALSTSHGPSFGAGSVVRVVVSFCACPANRSSPGRCEAVAYGRAMPGTGSAVRVCAPVVLVACTAAGTRTPSLNTGAFAYGRSFAAKAALHSSRKEPLPHAESVYCAAECSIGDLRSVLLGAIVVSGTVYAAGCSVDVAVSPPDIPCVVNQGTALSPLVAISPRDSFCDTAAGRALDEMVKVAGMAQRTGANVPVPRTLLLSGPSGSGKTHAVRSACKRHGIPLVEVGAREGARGLRSAFSRLSTSTLSAILVEDVDVLAARRIESSASDSLATLLVLLDGAMSHGRPLVIATTARPGAVDPALRRPGRLDREVSLGALTLSERKAMFSSLLELEPPDDIEERSASGSACSSIARLAERTVGYVAADVAALALRSASHADTPPQRMAWMIANAPPASLLRTDSSAMGSTLNASTWDDLGGIAHVRRAVERAAEWPLRRADAMARLGIRPARGVLLHGPPGCSKTTIARIIAARTSAAFFALVGGAAALYGAYVGEAEATLRQLFASARRAAPAVVFLDEIDAIVGRRGTGTSGASDEVSTRVLATLLNEMDGVDGHAGVLVLAATNRLDSVDDALLRPGRFDVLVHVPLPDDAGRRDILRAVTRATPLDPDAIEAFEIASGARTAGMSGADLRALVQEAALAAIARGADSVRACDVESALVRAGRPPL